MDSTQQAKQAAGNKAATFVTDGMRIGLGTGSTTAYALEAIGRRIRTEGLSIVGVPTSFAAERLARRHHIPVTTLDDDPHLDLALDGADEVDPSLNLIKGRGAAHTREKIVATQADRFVVLIDPSKEVDHLGQKRALPVEVVPMAIRPVMDLLESMETTPHLRMGGAKDGPVISDQGFWVVDAEFPNGIDDPHTLSQRLHQQPGVLDHGLFLDLATDVLVGHPNGDVRHRRR